MATRTFCDHCGNTVRNPKKFYYGPCTVDDPTHNHQTNLIQQQRQLLMAQQNQGPMGGAGGQGSISMLPPYFPTHQIKIVDLCETCTPIWLKRVAALTENSDPDEGN